MMLAGVQRWLRCNRFAVLVVASLLLLDTADATPESPEQTEHGDIPKALGALEQAEVVQKGTLNLWARIMEGRPFAQVSFTHKGTTWKYELPQRSLYASGAKVIYKTAGGDVQQPAPSRTFAAPLDWLHWGSVTFHSDGTISGLFDADGLISIDRIPQHERRTSARDDFENADVDRMEHGFSEWTSLPADDDGSGARRLAFSANGAEFNCPVKQAPEYKTYYNKSLPGDCYPGDSDMHEWFIDVVADVKAYERHSIHLESKIGAAIQRASFLYESQLNIMLKVRTLTVYTSNTSVPNNDAVTDLIGNCCDNKCAATNELITSNRLQAAGRQLPAQDVVGLVLFTGCGLTAGITGRANLNGACTSANQAVCLVFDDAWITLAHEMGHWLGAVDKPTVKSDGSNGGIMNYEQRTVDGLIQFNDDQKTAICSKLKDMKSSCPTVFRPNTSATGKAFAAPTVDSSSSDRGNWETVGDCTVVSNGGAKVVRSEACPPDAAGSDHAYNRSMARSFPANRVQFSIADGFNAVTYEMLETGNWFFSNALYVGLSSARKPGDSLEDGFFIKCKPSNNVMWADALEGKTGAPPINQNGCLANTCCSLTKRSEYIHKATWDGNEGCWEMDTSFSSSGTTAHGGDWGATRRRDGAGTKELMGVYPGDTFIIDHDEVLGHVSIYFVPKADAQRPERLLRGDVINTTHMLWARYWPCPPPMGPQHPPGQEGSLHADSGISGISSSCNKNDNGYTIHFNRNSYEQDNNYWAVVIAAWPSTVTAGKYLAESGVKDVRITRTCHAYRQRLPCNGPCAGGWVKLWPNTYLHEGENGSVELRNEYRCWGRKWEAEKMFDMGRRRGAVICGRETDNAIGRIVPAQGKAVSGPLTGDDIAITAMIGSDTATHGRTYFGFTTDCDCATQMVAYIAFKGAWGETHAVRLMGNIGDNRELETAITNGWTCNDRNDDDINNVCWNKIENPSRKGTMVSIIRDSTTGQFKLVIGGRLARSMPAIKTDPVTYPTLYACAKFGGGPEPFGLGTDYKSTPLLGSGNSALYSVHIGRTGAANLNGIDTNQATPSATDADLSMVAPWVPLAPLPSPRPRPKCDLNKPQPQEGGFQDWGRPCDENFTGPVSTPTPSPSPAPPPSLAPVLATDESMLRPGSSSAPPPSSTLALTTEKLTSTTLAKGFTDSAKPGLSFPVIGTLVLLLSGLSAGLQA